MKFCVQVLQYSAITGLVSVFMCMHYMSAARGVPSLSQSTNRQFQSNAKTTNKSAATPVSSDGVSTIQNNSTSSTHQSAAGAVFITALPMGRLGNQMSIYAMLYATARRNNRTPVLPDRSFDMLKEVFKISINSMLANDLENTTRLGPEWSRMDEQVEEFGHLPQKNFTIRGMFGTDGFYADYRTELREEFTFHDAISQAASAFLMNATKAFFTAAQNVTFVGVHVRRTDAITLMRERKGFTQPPLSYYINSMDYFAEKDNETVFVVTSDNIEWCMESIDYPRVIFAQNNTFAVDMAILACCNHTVTSISTFSLWAGFLSSGLTVQYAGFPPKNGKASLMKSKVKRENPDIVKIDG